MATTPAIVNDVDKLSPPAILVRMPADVLHPPFAWREQGNGPVVLLLHGLGGSRISWEPQMGALGPRRTVALDLPGYGESEPLTDDPLTWPAVADAAARCIDALGAERAHVVGISMGGMIGQTFALRHPGYFQTMILADTTSYYPPETQGPWGDRIKLAQEKGMAPFGDLMIGRWFTEGYVKSGAPALKRIGDSVRATKADGFIGCCHAIPKINLTAKLKDIKCPTLIIVGEQDPGTPVSMARDIHNAMPGSELVIIPNAAHLSNIEDATNFTRAVMDFLTGKEVGAPVKAAPAEAPEKAAPVKAAAKPAAKSPTTGITLMTNGVCTVSDTNACWPLNKVTLGACNTFVRMSL